MSRLGDRRSEASPRDDRLSPFTRLCFTPLAFFTAIFGPLLLLFPGDTRDYWAWPIAPDMSAVWVGAGYTFGAVSISVMLLLGRASSAFVPVVATIPFAIVMFAATMIHNDRFLTDTAGYYIWLAIYAILPVALPVMLWQNLQRDPGAAASDLLLPVPLQRVLPVVGVLMGLLGLVLVLSPSTLDQAWPWRLTPLMSQVIGGWLLFIATGGLAVLYEKRYVAYRPYFVTAALWFGILLVASLLNSDDFDSDRLSTPLYFVGLAAAVVGLIAGSFYMERRYKSREAVGG